MKYPYMTMYDETEITHSGLQEDGSVKVYIEKPVNSGFKNATCLLPKYEWVQNQGYSQEEMKSIESLIRANAHMIMEFATEGGFEYAAAI